MKKNILITGGAGFIGSNLVRHLLKEDDVIIVNLDKLTYAGNLENLAGLESRENYHFVKGDICDQKLVLDLFQKYDFDGVFHLAAESHVDRSILGPLPFIKTNIEGTFVLLEAARHHWKDKKHRRFIHVSTDEVYGSLGTEGHFTEETPYQPNSPYSASKAASDHLVRAYWKTYNLPCLITNCCNNYGPYQFPEKLIPLMILNGRDDKPLPVYGDGQQVRDWIYVEDHCLALNFIYKQGELGHTYCIGAREETTNLQIIKDILEILNKGEELISFVKDRPGHDRRYSIDPTKLEALGFCAQTKLKEGLKKTVEWYLAHGEWTENILTKEYQNYYREQYGS